MTERNRIVEKEREAKFFSMVPRYVWAMCRTTHEFTLWCVIRDIAGEEGECYLSTDQLAVLSMMSHGAASQGRHYLIRQGLLIGEVRQDPQYPQPVWHLSIPVMQLWQRTMEWVSTHETMLSRIEFKQKQRDSLWREREQEKADLAGPKSRHQVTGVESRHQVTEVGHLVTAQASPGDAKKNQKSKKNQKEEPFPPTPRDPVSPEARQAWAHAIGRLREELSKATFDTWLGNAQLIGCNHDVFLVGVLNGYARDWLESHLTSTMTHVLTGIVGHAVGVRFIVKKLADVGEPTSG